MSKKAKNSRHDKMKLIQEPVDVETFGYEKQQSLQEFPGKKKRPQSKHSKYYSSHEVTDEADMLQTEDDSLQDLSLAQRSNELITFHDKQYSNYYSSHELSNDGQRQRESKFLQGLSVPAMTRHNKLSSQEFSINKKKRRSKDRSSQLVSDDNHTHPVEDESLPDSSAGKQLRHAKESSLREVSTHGKAHEYTERARQEFVDDESMYNLANTEFIEFRDTGTRKFTVTP